jgi:hypothetical protein
MELDKWGNHELVFSPDEMPGVRNEFVAVRKFIRNVEKIARAKQSFLHLLTGRRFAAFLARRRQPKSARSG